MALTYTPTNLNSEFMPEFALPTVTGEKFESNSILSAKAKVIVFMCNHCPYVKAIEDRLIHLAKDLAKLDVPFVAICANDPADYPEDHPDELLKRWREKKYNFTYLIDETQEVARSFGAVCTPDFFVYDKENRLAYRGRLDDSWRDETKVTQRELKLAVDDLIKYGKLNAERKQSPSMGCSIKWSKN